MISSERNREIPKYLLKIAFDNIEPPFSLRFYEEIEKEGVWKKYLVLRGWTDEEILFHFKETSLNQICKKLKEYCSK